MSEKSTLDPDHNYFMALALKEAEKAFFADEVPVGAVLIDQEGDILSAAWNLLQSSPGNIAFLLPSHAGF